MDDILQNFLKWAWGLTTGLQSAVEWLFSSNESISNFINAILGTELEIAPIYLIGGGAFVVVLIAGILRAIL